MIDSTIRRRLTPDQRDTMEEQADARYEALFAELEDEARAAHDREFGSGVPYKPDENRIHAAVMQKMQ